MRPILYLIALCFFVWAIIQQCTYIIFFFCNPKFHIPQKFNHSFTKRINRHFSYIENLIFCKKSKKVPGRPRWRQTASGYKDGDFISTKIILKKFTFCLYEKWILNRFVCRRSYLVKETKLWTLEYSITVGFGKSYIT